MDPFGPFGITTVRTTPASPFTATALVLDKTSHWQDNDGAALVAPFNVIIRRRGTYPDYTFAEEVTVTAYSSTGITTMVRAQNGTDAMNIHAGDEVYPSMNGLLQQLKQGLPNSVNARAYAFTAQVVGGSLSVGSNTITIGPVPKGINGTDTAHYIYISGGTGTAEAVLITGGTAVSGRATGTLIITCAYTHSGQWAFSPATAGVQEAINHNPGKAIALDSTAEYNFFQSCYVPLTCPLIYGVGSGQTIVDCYFSGSPGFVGPNSGYQYITLRNFSLRCQIDLSAATSGYAGFFSSGAGQFAFEGMFIYNFWRGISLTSNANSSVTLNDNVVYSHDTAVDVMSYAGGHNNHLLSLRTISTYVASSAAINIHRSVGMIFSGIIHDGGFFEFGAVLNTNQDINELFIDQLYLDNWKTYGLTVTGNGPSLHVTLGDVQIFDLNGANYGLGGVAEQNAACILLEQGVINWQITGGCIGFGAGIGIYIVDGSKDVIINGMAMYSSNDGIITAGGGVLIANSSTPSNIQLNGCVIGRAFPGSSSSKATFGFKNLKAAMAGIGIHGGTIDAQTQAGKIVLVGDETDVSISNVRGIGNVYKTAAAAATLAFPVMEDNDTFTATGNTNVTAVTGLREGQRGTIVCTGTPTWTQGNNIGSPNLVAVANTPYTFTFTNSKLWIG